MESAIGPIAISPRRDTRSFATSTLRPDGGGAAPGWRSAEDRARAGLRNHDRDPRASCRSETGTASIPDWGGAAATRRSGRPQSMEVHRPAPERRAAAFGLSTRWSAERSMRPRRRSPRHPGGSQSPSREAAALAASSPEKSRDLRIGQGRHLGDEASAKAISASGSSAGDLRIAGT